MMQETIFVWTFEGVMQAITLGVTLVFVAVVGLIIAVNRFIEARQKRERK